MKGKLISSSQIYVDIPHYTKPDVLAVAVSFNGQDFSTSVITYGYFDPYLIKVSPTLIEMKGGTNVTLSGFGFVFSDPAEIKAKFLSATGGELKCGSQSPCILPATFVSKNLIWTESPDFSSLTHVSDGSSVNVTEDIVVEVTVYNNHFTKNRLTVRYMKPPVFK
jgi:hypothetical protein